MNDQKYQFEIELKSPAGELLAREAVNHSYLQPLVEDLIFKAQRQGRVGPDRKGIEWKLKPLPVSGDHPGNPVTPVEGLSLEVGFPGVPASRLTQKYSLAAFHAPSQQAVQRLVEEKKLGKDEKFQLAVLARNAPRPEPGPAGGAVLRQKPLSLVAGQLSELESRSEPLNEAARQDGDTPVFVHRRVLVESLRQSRRGGSLESGGFLAGRLFQQTDPRPEIFVLIEEIIEARHAEEREFSLTLTTETYLYLQKELGVLRERLGRPELMVLATCHGHSFLPSLSTDGKPNCPGCEIRQTCELHSSFFSESDILFHQVLFARQPYGVGLVWGLSPREEDVLTVHGFRDGALAERSISVID